MTMTDQPTYTADDLGPAFRAHVKATAEVRAARLDGATVHVLSPLVAHELETLVHLNAVRNSLPADDPANY